VKSSWGIPHCLRGGERMEPHGIYTHLLALLIAALG
jgi:hypothetical protein